MVYHTMGCMAITDSGRHLSPEDVADREGVPVTTVYQWRSRGTGPPGFRVGRHVRYRLADVVAWEERQLAGDRHGAAS